MEVADRTAADRKGGHLAQRPDGGLVLRETAQTPEDDVDAFQDSRATASSTRTRCGSTCARSPTCSRERDGVLGLPMIVNRKTVDPADADSPPVIQLETAMGAAIDVFDGARAIRVPRERFAPVKTTDDLLGAALRRLRADAGRPPRARRGARRRRPGRAARGARPEVFKLVRDFDARFAAGPPSLVQAQRLTVRGDVAFGAGVVVRGEVTVEHRGDEQRHIDDGSVLEG